MRRKPKRRSSSEWAKLVGAWERSGLSAEVFSSQGGFKAKTLAWWRWKLGSTACPTVECETPRLLPLEVLDVGPDEDETTWELRSAAGHVLRVRGALTRAQLEEVLVAMVIDGVAR